MSNKLTPEIISWAKAAENEWDVPALMNIAAATVESGLGAETPPGSHNWHGIKGAGPATTTKEQTAGGVWYTIKAGFHMFESDPDSFTYYAWLISHGTPYAAAYATWKKSPHSFKDVEALTAAVEPKYASALGATKLLLEVEEGDRTMVDQQSSSSTLGVVTMPATSKAPAAAVTTPKPATATPAIGGTTKVDIGDLGEQLLALAAKGLEDAVAVGEPMALANIPLGSIIGNFITPAVIDGYIEQAKDVASKAIAGTVIDVPTTAVALFKSGQPLLTQFLKGEVEPLFTKALAAIKSL